MNFKQFKIFAMASVAMFAVACQDAPDSDEAVVAEAQEETTMDASAAMYNVDLSESSFEWIGTKTGGRHNGTVNIQDGQIAVENGNITGGTFTLDMRTIVTKDTKMPQDKNDKLTGHLRSNDFFDADKYPEARFTITDVKPIEGNYASDDKEDTHEIDKYKVSNPTHEITGNLTVKDVTKSITFPAKIEVNKDELTATSKFNINRQDWGIDYKLMGDAILSDIIHIGIGLNADRADATVMQQ